mmetsp:Transcript_66376/g.203140  ORF Transcript_66376/g.203140 Transcript_66376/m.203140 type:complete len:218 (+) Transcript_66376:571-1224(+)
MKTGQICSDPSFKCWRRSHAKKSAKALCSFVASHCAMSLLHSGRHCENSAGAACMTAPMASSRLRRQVSSSSSPPSSSSSCCNSAGALATSALRSCSAFKLRCMEALMNWKSCPTNCNTSCAPKAPGPTFFRHSARPSADSRSVSGSSSPCMAAHARWRKVRNSSLDISPPMPRACSDARAHLISDAHVSKAALRASSQTGNSFESSVLLASRGNKF